jgi:hypothetical protein
MVYAVVNRIFGFILWWFIDAPDYVVYLSCAFAVLAGLAALLATRHL